MNEALLRKYAEFAVKIGVNPQPGQTMLINCPVEYAHLARLCAQVAYDAGASEVVVFYNDEALSRIRMERTGVEVLEDVKPWINRRYLDYYESKGGACILHIIAEDPEIYKGIDGDKIDRANRAAMAAGKQRQEYTMKDLIQWSIIAVPSPAWAAKVFPGDPNGVERLWGTIFDVCRVAEDTDTVALWRAHMDKLSACRDQLNAWDLESVRFQSANGTDLTVGLADGAVWDAANGHTPQGYSFIPNIPTEEVFTAPHRDRVNGVVYGTKPYVYNGDLIEDFCVTFRDGKVVSHSARVGEELLGKLLDTDEGARHIGEVALVPVSSPINRSGVLFYNTLFDENAACHIAFGQGYPGTVQGGVDMDKEALLAHGVNDSLIHEDVMVGTPDMTITGRRRSGGEVLIFKDGGWAF